MGELVYTNRDGMLSAQSKIVNAALDTGAARKALHASLNDFMSDMIGNTLKPMDDCARQMDTDLFDIEDRFDAISELLADVVLKRGGIDGDLGVNAAGKMKTNTRSRLVNAMLPAAAGLRK